MVRAKATAAHDTSAVLSPEESWRFLDAQARAIAGVSAEEFLRRIERGEYDNLPDDLDHAALRRLILLFTGGR
jgi:hypothetical protein